MRTTVLSGMEYSSTSEESVSFRRSSCCPFFFRRPDLPFTRASSSRRFFIFLDGLKSTLTFVWGSSLVVFQSDRSPDAVTEENTQNSVILDPTHLHHLRAPIRPLVGCVRLRSRVPPAATWSKWMPAGDQRANTPPALR